MELNITLEGGGKNKIKKIVFVRHGEATHNVATDDKPVTSVQSILTPKGREQATKTGKFVSKNFFKFDVVYSSPALRCIETAELIVKEIKYDEKKIVLDDLLIEMGHTSIVYNTVEGSLNATKKLESAKIKQLEKLWSDELNPFKKIELGKKLFLAREKIFQTKPDYLEVYNNCINFLNKLANTKETNILIITHGGIINILTKILCELDKYNPLRVSSKPYTKDDELTGNCCMLCASLDDGKYQMISPANTYHLIDK